MNYMNDDMDEELVRHFLKVKSKKKPQALEGLNIKEGI